VVLARDHGVEDLLPPTVKKTAVREKRALEGPKMRKMMSPKGHQWERTLKGRYVFFSDRLGKAGGGRLIRMAQVGDAGEGDAWDAESYREVEEGWSWKGMDPVAEVGTGVWALGWFCTLEVELNIYRYSSFHLEIGVGAFS